jgi:hypothetical protein
MPRNPECHLVSLGQLRSGQEVSEAPCYLNFILRTNKAMDR